MIGNALTAMQQGRILANAATWKNRTIAVNALGALLAAVLGIARAFGVDLPLDPAQIDAIALVLVTAVGLFNGWSTAATSTTVGLPDKRPPDPDHRPGDESVTEWDADYRQPGRDP